MSSPMVDLEFKNESGGRMRWSLAAAALSLVVAVTLQKATSAEADIFQQAVNYVFTGEVDPPQAPEIVDEKSCIIVMRDRKFNRFIRYYLRRFNMDNALIDKNYSGSRVSYELNVKGDDVLIEYLDPDRKTVVQGYRSAQIALPGEIDQINKALQIIFRDHCKPEKPKAPF